MPGWTCLNAACRERASALFPLPGTFHGSLVLGYFAFKCFHLTGQTCCRLSETLVGWKGSETVAEPPPCARLSKEGWFCRETAPKLLYPSLMEYPLPCLAQKITALTVEE